MNKVFIVFSMLASLLMGLGVVEANPQQQKNKTPAQQQKQAAKKVAQQQKKQAEKKAANLAAKAEKKAANQAAKAEKKAANQAAKAAAVTVTPVTSTTAPVVTPAVAPAVTTSVVTPAVTVTPVATTSAPVATTPGVTTPALPFAGVDPKTLSDMIEKAVAAALEKEKFKMWQERRDNKNQSTTTTTPAVPAAATFNLVQAVYGLGTDATAILQGKINNNSLVISNLNGLVGSDPAPGIGKTLTINYVNTSGASQTTTYAEGANATLTGVQKINWAYYAPTTGMLDITSKAAGWIAGNVLTLPVVNGNLTVFNNPALGNPVDPFPGKPKVLIVVTQNTQANTFAVNVKQEFSPVAPITLQ